MLKPLTSAIGIAAVGLLALVPEALAQTPLTTTRVISGLAAPLWVGSPPGDKERLFIVEQNTRLIRIFKNGALLPTPFLNVSSLASSGGERGLLGLAFHPNYAQNGYFFINYTAVGSGATQIARLKVSSNPDVADFSSGQVILSINQPFANHNGGHIEFGPDGYLYIGTGDGGSANDPGCRAQNPNDLLGKMLRIDVDTIDSTGTYGIPPSNPFVGVPNHRPEIWHLGLRNPWRWHFDKQTGDMYIGDVGQNLREEVSFQPAGVGGLNYGWKVEEGNVCGTGSLTACVPGLPPCGSPLYAKPIHTYVNTQFTATCAITGGFVYRGCAIPDLQGTYFFADYCTADIWTFRFDGTTVTQFTNRKAELAPGGGLAIATPSSFGVDDDGELYIVDQTGGEVFKIVPAGTSPVPCPPLVANQGVIQLTTGGKQSLSLSAGVGNAGSFYLLAGTTSGTQPGVVLDGVNLPLNPDFYTLITLNNPNQPPLAGSLGILDANGRASMSFALPANLLGPAAAGLQLHHAAAVLTPFATVGFASNPVGLKLIL